MQDVRKTDRSINSFRENLVHDRDFPLREIPFMTRVNQAIYGATRYHAWHDWCVMSSQARSAESETIVEKYFGEQRDPLLIMM